MLDPLAITTFINLLSLAMSLWLGFYIVLRSPRSSQSWLAALTLWSLTIYFFVSVVTDRVGTSSAVSWLDQLVILVIPFWVHLSFLLLPAHFETHKQFSIVEWVVIIIGYAIAVILIALGIVPTNPPVGILGLNQANSLIPRSANITAGSFNPYYPVFFVYLVIMGIIAVRNFWQSRRQLRYSSLQASYTLILAATGLVFVRSAYSSFGDLLRIPLFTTPADPLYPIGIGLLGYAVARHSTLLKGRPVDRDFVYSLLLVGAPTTFYLLVILALYLFGQVTFLTIPVTLVCVIMVTFVFDGARIALDQLLYRRAFQQLRANLRALAFEAGTGQTLGEQLQATLDALCRALRIHNASIAIKRREAFQVEATHNGLANGLALATSALEATEMMTLSHSEMRGLPGFILLVPLMAREVQIGAILLGPQESYQVYREQELELIEDLSNEIACAIFGKQQQEERIRQIDRMVSEYREKESTLELQFQHLQEAHRETKAHEPELESERLIPLVEDALRRLHDFAYLGEQELALLHLVTIKLEKDNNEPLTFIDRGKALSSVLVEALDELRPAGKEPPKQEVPPREWHPFIILHDAYVMDEPNRNIMARLYISQGTFNRTRRAALRAVARALQEMEQAAKLT